MSGQIHNARTPEIEIDSMFPDRWSPRAFLEDPIPDHHVRALFEAARWAPSCYNEQPWLFVYATEEGARNRFVTALMERNQLWAVRAPLLIFLFTKRTFDKTGKANRHAPFDAGAAWMALALQARRLGLYAHAMAGFYQDKAHEVTGVHRQEYEAMVAIAVGRRGDAVILPDDMAEMEMPNERNPLADIAIKKSGR